MSDDIDFRQAMRGVRPLKKETISPTSEKQQSRRTIRSQIQQRAEHSASIMDDPVADNATATEAGRSNDEGDSTLFFVRQGVQNKVLRDLKKGSRYSIDLTLDLHGLTQNNAQRAIDTALNDSVESGIRCLLIIHGKGLRSAQEATLKIFTARYLKTRAAVRAYCSAQPRDGGTGAMYVLLKG